MQTVILPPRLCLHPLLQDLPATSFTGKNITLNNPQYLNAKSINSANLQTWYVVGTVTNYTTQPANGTFINFLSNIKIQIQLPKVSLIRAIWWSRYFKDSLNGIITKFGSVSYTSPALMDNQSFITSLGFNDINKTVDIGNKNLTLDYFPQPIITNQITLGDITYSAAARNGSTLPKWNDGHTVSLQIELFGCDNYLLDEGIGISSLLWIIPPHMLFLF